MRTHQQDKIYRPLLGDGSVVTGFSLQNSNIKDTHSQAVKWVTESAEAGRPWIFAFDESGSAAHGQCPDIGYKGFDGKVHLHAQRSAKADSVGYVDGRWSGRRILLRLSVY